MKRHIALVLILAAACRREPPPPAAPARMPVAEATPLAMQTLDIDSDNLLNIAYGASVVSRTGEAHLEASALHAIDGLSFTAWTSPPGAPQQTLDFAFGGPSRVEQVGVTTLEANRTPKNVRISASSNGTTWREIKMLEPANKGTTIVDVPPFEARFIRVEPLEPNEQNASLVSVHAIGRELRAGERESFAGCWDLNPFFGRIEQRGARVTGIISGEQPTYLDGGIEGRVAKLMWTRGPMWGYAAATLTPDGNGISAIRFHEEPAWQNYGAAWIGSRMECGGEAAALKAAASLPHSMFKRVGSWAMSGLIFDDDERMLEEPSRVTLDDAVSLIASMPKQRFRIIAREFRRNDPRENHRLTSLRIDALRNALRARGVDLTRIDFVASGSESSSIEKPSAVQRMLWSRIDLERL